MSALAKLALYLMALAVVLGASFALGRALGADEDPVPPTTSHPPVTEPAPATPPTAQHSGTHDLHSNP